MTYYPPEYKAELIQRMLPPENIPVKELEAETGISKNTLYSWCKRDRKKRGLVKKVGSKSKWTSEEKFLIVLETASLSESEIGEYCRKKGIYRKQIAKWYQACSQANLPSNKPPAKASEEAKTLEKRLKKLEKELGRKDKALAETAALLVLRKKANAIWGDSEDE